MRTLVALPDSLRKAFPQQGSGGGSDRDYNRACQQTYKEARALLGRVRRAAFSVLASGAVLAPLLIACISLTSRHVHSAHRTWLLAIALAAFSALTLLLAIAAAARCLGLCGLSSTTIGVPLMPQKLRRGRLDLIREGEALLERANAVRKRAEQGVAPLILARRSLTLSIAALVLAGVTVLIAEAL